MLTWSAYFSLLSALTSLTDPRSYGSACGFLGEPFINNCNFDASGAMLRHIYGPTPLNPRAASVNRANVRLALPIGDLLGA